MAFPLEKILTISAEEYVHMVRKNPNESFQEVLSRYSPVGIHEAGNSGINPVHGFAEKVPDNTEVVVGYRSSWVSSVGHIYLLASGTALIPKSSSA